MTGGVPRRQEIDPTLLERFQWLVESRSGVVVDDRKVDALEEAISAVSVARGLGDPVQVLDACEADRLGGGIFDELLGHLLIGETHFFRNRPHFQALSDVVLPELFQRNEGTRALRIWSAGCATGEEAYSLAITVDAVAQREGIDLSRWSLQLTGSDVSSRMLDVARRAEYGTYSFRGVTDEERSQYFEEVADGHRVLPRYRRMVEFRRFNLKTGRLPNAAAGLQDLDLIVCRNVTIYFSHETTRQLADRTYESLADGGYLLVGHSEHSLETYRRYQTRALPDVILYQRGGDRTPTAVTFPSAPANRANTLEPLLAFSRSRRMLSTDVPIAPPAAASSPAEPTLRDAHAALDAGDLNGAVALAVAVVERDPENADACCLLGKLAADRGHATEAEIWMRRAVDLAPLDVEGHYLLALLALERSHGREALRCLDRAIYLEPDFVMGHLLRERLLRANGRHDAAQRSRRTAVEILQSLPVGAEVPSSQGLSASQLLGLLGEAIS